jgi:hypothetical protein
MDIIDPAFGSSNVQSAAVEVNLIPPQAAQFRGTETMAVGDQDHGGVPVPVAGSLAGSFLEPLDLFFGQILSGPKLGIRRPTRNCPVYDGRGRGFAGGFCHVNQPRLGTYCL